jgi:L,D-transpeptidase YcbB
MTVSSGLLKVRALSFGILAAALWTPSLVAAQEMSLRANEAPAEATPSADKLPEPVHPASGVPAAICARLATTTLFEPSDRADVIAFYQSRQCRPLWINDNERTSAADLVTAELGRAGEWGLDVGDFKLSTATKPISSGQSSAEYLADVDLDISAAVVRYAHHAEGSRIPDPEKQLADSLDRAPVITPASQVLAQFADKPNSDEILRAFQPSQDQFLKLKALLASLRGEATTSQELPTIPQRGPMLASGVQSPDVATLKKHFDIASEPGKEQVFDDKLETAVKRFQASKGLSDDGIIGPATRAALAGGDTRSNADKIAAVIANMEEWRWMPRSLGGTRIFVNVPSFMITLTQDGKTVFNDRVVVGTAEKQTPIFSKDMRSIVLRPRWNIPDSIKLSMLLSGRSIESQGYVVMRNGRKIDSSKVNWAKANLSAYTFYQPAGDDNALGLVKLLFPNKHSVYLHDTPSKSLFNEPVRLYSHGCMRVRNPQVFAQAIFDIDRGPQAPNVKQLVRHGPMDNEISLDHPIPVHVGYFTVWVDDDGQTHYYNDWYGHQKRITLALAGKWTDIEVATAPPVDTTLLKQVKFNKPKRASNTDAPSDGDSYRRYDGNGGVGDIIRQVLGF